RNGSPLQALGRGEQNPDNGYTNSFWPHFYRGINRVNFIISNSSHLREEMDAATYDELMAETRFFRAFFYSYLTELYGDVPLLTEMVTLEDSQTPRTSKSEVVDFVLSELDLIIAQLPSDVASKDRITKGAALYIKSRVALCNERWDVSAAAAKQLMNERSYQVDEEYASMFTNAGDNSPEVILRVQYL